MMAQETPTEELPTMVFPGWKLDHIPCWKWATPTVVLLKIGANESLVTFMIGSSWASL